MNTKKKQKIDIDKYIVLSANEKKTLFAVLDIFFKKEYYNLLNSIYNFEQEQTNITQLNSILLSNYIVFLFIHLHLYAKCKKISELLKKNKRNLVKRNSVKRNSVKRNSVREGLEQKMCLILNQHYQYISIFVKYIKFVIFLICIEKLNVKMKPELYYIYELQSLLYNLKKYAPNYYKKYEEDITEKIETYKQTLPSPNNINIITKLGNKSNIFIDDIFSSAVKCMKVVSNKKNINFKNNKINSNNQIKVLLENSDTEISIDDIKKLDVDKISIIYDLYNYGFINKSDLKNKEISKLLKLLDIDYRKCNINIFKLDDIDTILNKKIVSSLNELIPLWPNNKNK